jgi:hypothetical protein
MPVRITRESIQHFDYQGMGLSAGIFDVAEKAIQLRPVLKFEA